MLTTSVRILTSVSATPAAPMKIVKITRAATTALVKKATQIATANALTSTNVMRKTPAPPTQHVTTKVVATLVNATPDTVATGRIAQMWTNARTRRPARTMQTVKTPRDHSHAPANQVQGQSDGWSSNDPQITYCGVPLILKFQKPKIEVNKWYITK